MTATEFVQYVQRLVDEEKESLLNLVNTADQSTIDGMAEKVDKGAPEEEGLLEYYEVAVCLYWLTNALPTKFYTDLPQYRPTEKDYEALRPDDGTGNLGLESPVGTVPDEPDAPGGSVHPDPPAPVERRGEQFQGDR